ncbi:MAG: hypothetical protein KatS3mg097_628 [Candidatus Parcubacteria bacterium]|nr:MAG: hypothetical protein KatS3mg097_628 [Candidatus Parcubacteria bacterium]
MKKYLTFFILIIVFVVGQLTFAQNSIEARRRQVIRDLEGNVMVSTTTPTTTRKVMHDSAMTAIRNFKREGKTDYNACVGRQVKELRKEMRAKRREASNEFNTEFKAATTVEAKREARIKHNQAMREIRRLFNQELRRIQQECRQLNIPQPSTSTSSIPPTTSTSTSRQSPSEITIKITNSGFEPKEVTISRGTKVTWINESDNSSWPASAVHPTHKVYPGSGIEKCGTPEQVNIFDACKSLSKGESWSFVFNEIGEWYYHDHVNPSLKGEINVE